MTLKTVSYDEALYRLVPIEPTREMLDAEEYNGDDTNRRFWHDLLSAAPPAPTQPEAAALTNDQIHQIAFELADSSDDGNYTFTPDDLDDFVMALKGMPLQGEARTQPEAVQEGEPIMWWYRWIGDSGDEWSDVQDARMSEAERNSISQDVVAFSETPLYTRTPHAGGGQDE